MNEALDNHKQGLEDVTNMVIEDEDGDQGSYTGSIMRNSRHPEKSFPFGFGKMVYDQGDIYEGEWKEGLSYMNKTNIHSVIHFPW
jgi:hypothetical protein